MLTLLWVPGARLPAQYVGLDQPAEIRVDTANTILDFSLLQAAEITLDTLQSMENVAVRRHGI